MIDIKCELMRLKEDKISEYIKMHLNPWPELIEEFLVCGFQEVYTFIDGNVVIVFMKSIDIKNSKERLENSNVFKKWTKIVRSMLIKNNDVTLSPELVINSRCIFDLNNLIKKRERSKKDGRKN